ncbi:hypothetical protein Pelo_16199 [Pelomyxa schiedti]|nr:hypothetical protein Pelo_16199 [Pelomyxa schiedti]
MCTVNCGTIAIKNHDSYEGRPCHSTSGEEEQLQRRSNTPAQRSFFSPFNLYEKSPAITTSLFLYYSFTLVPDVAVIPAGKVTSFCLYFQHRHGGM